MCDWKCPHAKCDHRCYDFCNRQPCKETSPKDLFCGHPCNGLCGEIFPPHCPSCALVEMPHKDGALRYCYHLRNVFIGKLNFLFDLDISTWSVNIGSKWKKWTNGFTETTAKRRLPESNARRAQSAISPSNYASVTVTGSKPFTST